MYVPSGRREKQQGYGHVRFRHPWAAGERTFLHTAGRYADRVQFSAGHERFRGRGHPARHRPRVAGLRGHGRQSGVAVRYPSDVAGVFLAGNILCALAPNYAVLVVARIMIAAVSGTWVANMFGWRWAFHLVIAMTVVVIVLIIAVLPHHSTWRRLVFATPGGKINAYLAAIIVHAIERDSITLTIFGIDICRESLDLTHFDAPFQPSR